MSAKEKLQDLINSSNEQMDVLLKNNPPEQIIKRIIRLCEAVKKIHSDAVFGITPNYVMISIQPGTRGTKVVELLPKKEEVVVNVMKLPINVDFQKGRPQYFSDLIDENGNPKINWYRLDFKEDLDFDTMLGAILDVYDQKLHK